MEWITYTSIDGSNEFVGVTRGAEGGTARTHENNAVVAFPISESHINNLVPGLSIEGDATNLLQGILDEDDMASDSAVKGSTQQAVKAYVDSFNYASTRMRAYLNSQKTLTLKDTYYTIVFDVEDYDTGSNYNNTTGQYTVPVAGVYMVVAGLNINGTVGDNYFIRVYGGAAGDTALDAKRFVHANIATEAIQIVSLRYFAANDLINIQAYNDTTDGTTIDTGTTFSYLEICRVA